MLEKHCRACGAALIEKELKGEGVVPFCPVCGEFRFPMYNVAVSMIVKAVIYSGGRLCQPNGISRKRRGA